MHCMTEPTNTPPQDTIDRLQQCQDLLIENKELSEQKEELIKRLAVCEGTVEERRSMLEGFTNDCETDPAEKAITLMQAKLSEHKNLVRRQLKNIKELQSVYHELSLDLLNKADSGWLHRRRKTVLIAFHLAKDIHVLLMQKSRDFVSPCGERKRRPVKVYRGGRRSRKY